MGIKTNCNIFKLASCIFETSNCWILTINKDSVAYTAIKIKTKFSKATTSGFHFLQLSCLLLVITNFIFVLEQSEELLLIFFFFFVFWFFGFVLGFLSL